MSETAEKFYAKNILLILRTKPSPQRRTCSHLDWRSRQDDTEVGRYLLDGLGKLGLPILNDMALIQDTIIKFNIPEKEKTPHLSALG